MIVVSELQRRRRVNKTLSSGIRSSGNVWLRLGLAGRCCFAGRRCLKLVCVKMTLNNAISGCRCRAGRGVNKQGRRREMLEGEPIDKARFWSDCNV